MEAWVLILSSLETGRRLGVGLLCFEARYASIGWHGAERLERLHASPQEWKAIGREVQAKFESGVPLPHDAPIGRLFSGRGSDVVV